MSKHTPGPWHWESDEVKNDPTGRVRYQVTTIGKTITRVYYSSFEGGPTNAEWDARLIAAAPDLLEALQALALYADECELIVKETHYAKAQSLRLRVEAAIAAIAKATGSTQ